MALNFRPGTCCGCGCSTRICYQLQYQDVAPMPFSGGSCTYSRQGITFNGWAYLKESGGNVLGSGFGSNICFDISANGPTGVYSDYLLTVVPSTGNPLDCYNETTIPVSGKNCQTGFASFSPNHVNNFFPARIPYVCGKTENCLPCSYITCLNNNALLTITTPYGVADGFGVVYVPGGANAAQTVLVETAVGTDYYACGGWVSGAGASVRVSYGLTCTASNSGMRIKLAQSYPVVCDDYEYVSGVLVGFIACVSVIPLGDVALAGYLERCGGIGPPTSYNVVGVDEILVSCSGLSPLDLSFNITDGNYPGVVTVTL